MKTILGLPDYRPWQSHGDGGFVIRHGDMDDGDDDDDTDDDDDDEDYDDDDDDDHKCRKDKSSNDDVYLLWEGQVGLSPSVLWLIVASESTTFFFLFTRQQLSLSAFLFAFSSARFLSFSAACLFAFSSASFFSFSAA